jgi:hypothetical protein
MIAEYYDKDRLIHIRADTCGTASSKTIFIGSVGCEMSVEEGEEVVKLITSAINWLKNEPYNKYDPDCIDCQAYMDFGCPMFEGKDNGGDGK